MAIADSNKRCKRCGGEGPRYSQRQVSPVSGKVWQCSDALCKDCRKRYSLERRRQLKQRCVEYLGGHCQDCGLVDVPEVYDFHHLDPAQKDFSFGEKGNRSFDSLRAELDKCLLLCANCHRKRHARVI